MLGSIDLDHIRLALPMCTEYHNSFWLDFLRDFFADFLELGVDGVFGVIHYVWLIAVSVVH